MSIRPFFQMHFLMIHCMSMRFRVRMKEGRYYQHYLNRLYITDYYLARLTLSGARELQFGYPRVSRASR